MAVRVLACSVITIVQQFQRAGIAWRHDMLTTYEFRSSCGEQNKNKKKTLKKSRRIGQISNSIPYRVYINMIISPIQQRYNVYTEREKKHQRMYIHTYIQRAEIQKEKEKEDGAARRENSSKLIGAAFSLARPLRSLRPLTVWRVVFRRRDVTRRDAPRSGVPASCNRALLTRN